jgi:hypothetical protein
MYDAGLGTNLAYGEAVFGPRVQNTHLESRTGRYPGQVIRSDVQRASDRVLRRHHLPPLRFVAGLVESWM